LALQGKWDLKDTIQNGRSNEVSVKGLATIKQESLEIHRTRPGKYSRKFVPQSKRNTSENKKDKCQTCTSWRCKGGKECIAQKGECYSCQKKGHYSGAAVCKKKHSHATRKVDASDENNTDSEASDLSDVEANVSRLFSRIPTVRFVGKVRKNDSVRRTKSRYEFEVIVKSKKIKVYADTGAEINVMSKKMANNSKLKNYPTKMAIKPYNSNTKPCFGETVATFTFCENVANVKFYIIDAKLETLISGPDAKNSIF